MQFFIESADVAEIKKVIALGLCDGATTTASLAARTGRKFSEILKEVTGLVGGPVFAEVAALDYDGMIAEARTYARVAENVVVKLPFIAEGLRAVRDLTTEGVRTELMLCFTPTQALLAAKAGATYVSTQVGHLDDVAEDGLAVVARTIEIFRNYDFTTKVLVASVRHPVHILEAARLGADAATVPYAMIDELVKHPLTASGLKERSRRP
jgi:transaldolase